jgi:hypothetical protein
MTTITSLTPTFPTTDAIIEALQHLSPKYRPDVLQFIHFLEYKSLNTPDEAGEDDALWDDVQADQTYKAQPPDVVLERYQSGTEFLATEFAEEEHQRPKESLETQPNIPAPRQVKVAGRLDGMTLSDCTFKLLTAEQQCPIKCLAKSVDKKTLSTLLGKDILVSGTAHFSASGEVFTIEAEQIIIAKAHDIKLWGQVPTPLHRPFKLSDFKVPHGPDSGMSAIYGKWPSDETDEEVLKALEELS